MEPVEINAGTWYLRALRDDTRVTDVPALTELGITDPTGFVVSAARGWADESRFTWAVCEPTTGELMSLIVVDAEPPALTGRARPGQQHTLDDAVPVITRFAVGALDIPLD
ncbi:hypothetical protein GOEFS_128_00270 [Gordonia effusa NBRC 100432]|uniref:Uncharacterized protein n=1 Tax=Gordonia effusa NBRC 100432 TaxID=1077974 RepID=H0R6Q8_9ACTN|nr:hypothetical protein [Gordonia effusa]GAB20759.1 hypothetical protein GOEFS_128_00270 [Gordonia effusa NBRC 100432]